MNKHRKEAERIYDAPTERTVGEILQDDFYDDENWVPLGDEKNNYGIVENQAASPMAALAEIVINSVDAILLKNYKQRFNVHSGESDQPEFGTLETAADELVDEQKEELTIAATGKKAGTGGPISLSIEDTGEGKPPDKFEKTFLGLLSPGSLKQDYEFLQGQYGMGSTGVLPFCGNNGYKLIISSSHQERRRWSWSLIRKNEQRTCYEYFTIDGEIPTFSGEFKGKEFGSFVKLFNYDINQRSNISSDRNMRRYLERYLLQSPISINLEERRDYESYQMSDTTDGLLPHIKNEYDNLIKSNHYIRHSFDNKSLGTRDIEVILFKGDDVLSKKEEEKKRLFVRGEKHRKQAIFFSVNGQTHGDQGKTFISNRCSRSKIANDVLIILDFSDISGTNLVNLFKPSRDRLTDKEIASDLISGLEKAIEGDDVLRDEEQIRRERTAGEADEDLDEIFNEIFDSNSLFRSYFDPSDENNSEGSLDNKGSPVDLAEIDYEPPYVPKELKPIETFRSRIDYETYDGSEGIYEIEVPVDKTRRVRFHLNGPDDYFNRKTDSGELRVIPGAALETRQFKTGILSLDLSPLPNSRPGTEIPVTIEVDRPSDSSLSTNIRLVCTEEKEDNQDAKDSNNEDVKFQPPSVIEVTEETWGQHDFSPRDVVKLDDYTSENEGFDVFVNMDCDQLTTFISDQDLDPGDATKIQRFFKRAVAMYTVSQYLELSNDFNHEENPESEIEATDTKRSEMKDSSRSIDQDADVSAVVADGIRGLAWTLPHQYLSQL